MFFSVGSNLSFSLLWYVVCPHSNDHRPDAAARKRLIVQEMTMANVVVLILLPPLASASSSERPMIYYCMLFARARPPLPRDVVPVTLPLPWIELPTLTKRFKFTNSLFSKFLSAY
ncbi:hypothetical protein NPIL_686051 [Nephila pilipes]|uniref:Uncharacterized protein n=1 Tax=Nephila pilipes TaxID=299642 RepID=A0A8X6QVA6_NEPPI|nr:hypothetical protein NPIL_686051 [Nephila pilipes]